MNDVGDHPGDGSQPAAEADVEDFTDESIGGDVMPTISAVARTRESIRGRLASALVALLAVVVVGAGVIAAAGWMTLEDTKSLLEVLLPPVIALTGTALGFYFGGSKVDQPDTTPSTPAKPGRRHRNS